MNNEKNIVLAPLNQPELSLEVLATRLRDREKQIDAAVDRAVHMAAEPVRLAIEQGEDLLKAKAQVKHGQWLPWLKENFPKSERRARDYMDLYNRREKLAKSNPKSIEDAFRMLGMLPEVEHRQVEMVGISIPAIVQRLNFIAEWNTKESDQLNDWETPRLRELDQRLQAADELRAKVKRIIEERER